MSELDEQFEVAPQTQEPEVIASEPEPVAVVAEPEVVSDPAPLVEEIAKSKNVYAADSAQKVVSMSSLVFQSLSQRSLSVAYVQERLLDLGFGSAGSDKRGWLSVGTKEALDQFCGCAGDDHTKDKALIERLFVGTEVSVLS
jgi:hypothetical protein